MKSILLVLFVVATASIFTACGSTELASCADTDPNKGQFIGTWTIDPASKPDPGFDCKTTLRTIDGRNVNDVGYAYKPGDAYFGPITVTHETTDADGTAHITGTSFGCVYDVTAQPICAQ